MSLRRVRIGLSAAAGITTLLASGHLAVLAGAPPAKSLTLTPIGVYRAQHFDGGAAEIAAHDPLTQRVFVVNLAERRVDALDISTPASPVLAYSIDVTPWGSQANSVAVDRGLVAIAIEANLKTENGTVAFFDNAGRFLSAVPVGALPDMLTFTPNGHLVLVANEGEPDSYNQPTSIDPEGSVSIIDLRGGVERLTAADVTTADFRAFNDAPLPPSVRIFGPHATVAQDLEPEYIAVSRDSRTAWVTLQENNALAILDLQQKRVTSVVGLGFKNHAIAANGFDSSDRDNQTINIQPRPVWGMYQPDGIATFEHRGETFLITANEGDVREYPGLPGGSEASRVSALTLDPAAFPAAAALRANAVLGRLNVTRFLGDADGDGDYEQLYAFGARSFSVWNARGAQVFDSGDALERLIAQRLPQYFNATHTNNVNTQPNPNDWTRDSRSDDKGPEPEGVTVARLFGRQYAFVVLERIGGIVVSELTDPAAPRFVDYVNTRTFGVPADSAEAEDLGPEGVIVIGDEDSPTGRPLLIVANEVSGTTRIYEIALAH